MRVVDSDLRAPWQAAADGDVAWRRRDGARRWLLGHRVRSVLNNNDHEMTLACRDPEQAAAITETGSNPRYLPGADLEGVGSCTFAEAPYDDADVVVVAVPSTAFGEVVERIPGTAPILSLTKGLDPGSGRRLSTLVRERPVAVLSGPNIAEEIARSLPARP